MDLSEVSKLDAPAKVLKLSALARLGAQIRPQARHQYFSGGKSCFWGAVSEASGCEYEDFKAAEKTHGSSLWDSAYLAYVATYKGTMATHNDAGVSREIIADRLEAIGF